MKTVEKVADQKGHRAEAAVLMRVGRMAPRLMMRLRCGGRMAERRALPNFRTFAATATAGRPATPISGCDSLINPCSIISAFIH